MLDPDINAFSVALYVKWSQWSFLHGLYPKPVVLGCDRDEHEAVKQIALCKHKWHVLSLK